MINKSYLLAVGGLILGLLIGIAITIVEKTIASELLSLLSQEASAACQGEVRADHVRVSLLRLTAIADRPRLVINNRIALQFQQARASFGISQIFKRRILLSKLELLNGSAEGIGSESATFQFIDYLTEPIPPEKIRPDHWQIKLQNLEVIKSRFVERLKASELHGNEVSLVVERDQNDDFWLKPRIGELSLHTPNHMKNGERPWVIGEANGSLQIVDQGIFLKNILLKKGNSFFEISGRTDKSRHHKLSGKIRYRLDHKFLTLSPDLSFLLNGNGKLGGFISDPIIRGDISLAPETKVRLKIKDAPDLTLSSLKASFLFNYNDNQPFIRITDATARGKQLSVKSDDIYISDPSISGVFSIEDRNFELASLSLSDIKVAAELSGTFDQPEINLNGILGKVTLQNYETPALGFAVSHKNDLVNFTLIHQGHGLGKATATGVLRLSDSPPQLQNVSYEIEELHLRPAHSTSKETLLESLRLTGKGVLNGPLDPEELEANGELVLSSGHFAGEAALKGNASLLDGKLSVEISNDSHSLNAKLLADFITEKKGSLEISLNDFKPAEYDPNLECIGVDLALHYEFPLKHLLLGNGNLSLNKIDFGCEPYQVRLARSHQLPIKRGVLKLPNIALQAHQGELLMHGKVSSKDGFQIRAKGAINLNSLIGFLPSVDDLRGTIVADLAIGGPLRQPDFSGVASIKNGEIAVEMANISATNVKGSLNIAGDKVEVQNLVGAINGGNFILNGTVFPDNLARSNLSLRLRSVLLEPNPDTIMDFNADLSLIRNNRGRAAIEGSVVIESAEFRKNIDLLSLIQTMTAQIFSRQDSGQETFSLPEIDLNVNIEATRNLFVFTNWLGGELRGLLKVTGSLSAPLVNGELETITGWFGLRDRRFQITTGRIIFKPDSKLPRLEVLAESNFFTRGGDNATVLVEILGPLNDPRVSLSSDIGIPQREILGLITTGGSLSERTLVNVIGHDLELEEPSLIEELSSLDWRRLLRGLTRIDSLTIVPRYNAQTGLIEPSLFVEKRITPRISAIGESFVGRNVNQGKIGLLFKISPSVNLITAAEAYAPRNESHLSVDLVKTILAAQIPFVELSFKGNKSYKDSELQKGLYLTSDSRIPREEIPSLQEDLKSFYSQSGYHQAKIDVVCLDDQTYCRHITFNIKEGKRSQIAAIAFEGDSLQNIVDISQIEKVLGKGISTNVVEKLQSNILGELRSKDYFGARVSVTPQVNINESEVTLIITAFTGNKISFDFAGNNRFTSDTLLETINLYKRRQPFGANTINILVENIEKKYRENGYLFTTLSYQHQLDPESKKSRYIITIREEQQATVSSVILSGADNISQRQLLGLVERYYPTVRNSIFFPDYAVAEQLERNAEILRSLYVEEGFPDASVQFDLHPNIEGDSVTIEYLVTEGRQIVSEWLEISGLPDDMVQPHLPPGPYSIPKANGYIEELLDSLRASGYLQPQFSSSFMANSNRLVINFITGPRTRISEIQYQGNLVIDSKTIEKQLKVKTGDPWIKERIHASRRQLLHSGLFSRVEIEPADGELDSAKEALLIRVTERPLQTLELGIGQNTSLGSHLFLEAVDKSLFKDGRTISLRSDIYYQLDNREITQGIASLRYSDPAFLYSDFRLNEDLRYQKIDTSTLPYDLDRFSLASYIFKPNLDHWDWTIGHTILEEDLSRVKQDVILSEYDDNLVMLSFLSGTASYDNRDDPLVPMNGFLLSGDYKLSSQYIGSDASYFALGGKASLFAPFNITSHRFVWAVNSQIATARPFDGTSNIPISQRYFLGGGSSIRGFSENSLGPKGSDGNPIGGDLLFANNFELRYALLESLWLQTFIDAGNVFLQNRSVDLGDIRTSSGIGLRFISPIGPIGLDIARPIDHKAGERDVRVHFSIGANF